MILGWKYEQVHAEKLEKKNEKERKEDKKCSHNCVE